MTVVMLGRQNKDGCMEFSFDSAMDAFTFYAQAKDSYREDDIYIAMVDEGGEDDV